MEEWRTVVHDSEVFSKYEVSTEGRVRSLNYYGHGKTQILELTEDKNGYYQISLYSNDNIRKTRKVHRLVAFTFPDKIPNDNPTEKTQVNHINENKHDNRVENLEWVTPKQNMQHGTRTERQAKSKSKKVLCVETGVIYESIVECARQTGLPKSSIWRCCNNKNKTCGGFHWEFVN